MKILIVEDEFNAREGLATLITKISPEHEVCGKAADGEEGYEMAISLKPDLIFVDIELPKLNGLEMIEKILHSVQKPSEGPAFVILSGYADFQYAQKAISCGVSEYLLKPITYDKLKNVIQNLGKLQDTKKEYGGRKSIAQEEIISSILLNSENKDQALKVMKKTIVPENMYVVNIYYGQNTDTEAISRTVNSFCERCSYKNYLYSILPDHKYLTFFINSNYNLYNIEDKINYNLIMSLKKFEFIDFTITLIPIGKVEDLSHLLPTITDLNSWALTLGNDKVIYADRILKINCMNSNKVRKFDLEALSAIKNEDVDKLLKINKELLIYLKDNKFNPVQIKKICTSYVFSILVCYKEFKTDMYERAQNERIFDNLKDSCTMGQIKNCLDRLAVMYSDSSSTEQKVNSILIKKVLNYIVESYSGKVALEEIADQMNLSSEYLSHLFTKEVGTSFSDYLKKYRISVAKKLMANSNLKIYEVGEKIGYKDPKYFCKMFKEVTGYSPKEYITKG
ncbi:MAG TPA: response regulator [Oscillospiraceae bacterium]|nr:response regulator [Oscillospiraceae bacterium]